MDLETENRLAALLMEEARRLRAEADREGVHVYLKPNVRGRPNSRFLTATVLGVQQANRAVEVNEMWSAREKELELEVKLKRRSQDKDAQYVDKNHDDSRKRVTSSKHEGQASRSFASTSSRKYDHHDDTCYYSDAGGLKDDEVEEFLRSRAKRGRGAIGSRMDEPGPYPLSGPLDDDDKKLSAAPDTREKEEWEYRVFRPDKPSFVKSHELIGEEIRHADSSKEKHPSREKKRRSKEEQSKSKRKKNKESRKCKHHRHHKRRRSRSDSSDTE